MSAAAIQWVAGGDTGISSMAIWTHMMGGDPSRSEWAVFGNYPSDPGDFGRCYRLLRLMPGWRARIGEMARYGSVWAGLAEAWDELEELYEAEVDVSAAQHRGSAPRLYARMKAIESAAPHDTERTR